MAETGTLQSPWSAGHLDAPPAPLGRMTEPNPPGSIAEDVMRVLLVEDHKPLARVLRGHDLEIDTAARTVKRAGQSIALTPREYGLLEFLAFHRGKVATRSMIWEHLYDEQDESTSNVVDVYIRYLRNKIDKGHELPLIMTRWGEGYLLR